MEQEANRHVSETGGDGCECQIDYYQADRADEKVTVDGEESPDLVAIESGLEIQKPRHLLLYS